MTCAIAAVAKSTKSAMGQGNQQLVIRLKRLKTLLNQELLTHISIGLEVDLAP